MSSRQSCQTGKVRDMLSKGGPQHPNWVWLRFCLNIDWQGFTIGRRQFHLDRFGLVLRCVPLWENHPAEASAFRSTLLRFIHRPSHQSCCVGFIRYGVKPTMLSSPRCPMQTRLYIWPSADPHSELQLFSLETYAAYLFFSYQISKSHSSIQNGNSNCPGPY